MLENPPRANAGVAGFFTPPTWDKMMDDRKHLVFAEVEKLGGVPITGDGCKNMLVFRMFSRGFTRYRDTTQWCNGGILVSFRGETIIRKVRVHDRLLRHG